MKFFLKRRVNDLHKKGLRIRIIGNAESFPKDIQELIKKAMETTKDNTGMTVTFGINYGGRDEIIRGMKKAAKEGSLEDMTIDDFGKYLDTKDIPDPELIIRTGGEKRVSGFMLWQSEYAEYAFLEKLFPDFKAEDFHACIESFNETERRFGK